MTSRDFHNTRVIEEVFNIDEGKTEKENINLDSVNITIYKKICQQKNHVNTYPILLTQKSEDQHQNSKPI